MNEEEITAFRKLYTEIKKVAQTVIWKLHEAYPIERYKYLAFDSVDEYKVYFSGYDDDENRYAFALEYIYNTKALEEEIAKRQQRRGVEDGQREVRISRKRLQILDSLCIPVLVVTLLKL